MTEHEIANRVQSDSTKPNNKIANAYPSYITNTLVGYFMGKPVTYNCGDPGVLEYLTQSFEYNDEADENVELAKSASIYGIAYEQLYIDSDGVVRFKNLPTIDCIPVYDTTVENNLLYFIRYYSDFDITTEKTYYRVEVMDKEKITNYTADESMSSMQLIEEVQHYFSMVPIAIYKNNEEETGDFERVISLIDAYDKMESDTLNDFEYFSDAYLALYGFTADPEDIKKMKENRVLLMDEGTNAEWLIKNADDNTIENSKNRLDNDIHKFSFCPSLSDENFASNASGVAIKFKTLGTENLTSIKERKFKKGLQQRLELMAAIAAIKGTSFMWEDIEIIFTRNLPSNDTDVATMVNSLKDVVSTETLLAQLPFVTNVQDEMEKLKKEREEDKENNPFYQSISGYSQMRAQEDNKNELDDSTN